MHELTTRAWRSGLRRTQALGVPHSQICVVIDDRGTLATDLALRFACCFRTSPQFWLGLQTGHDFSVAEARFGEDIIARIQPIAA